MVASFQSTVSHAVPIVSARSRCHLREYIEQPGPVGTLDYFDFQHPALHHDILRTFLDR